MKKIFCFTLALAICFAGFFSANADAKKKNEPEKILYIPHDNRPIVNEQTIAVIEKAGYKVISPPDYLLGNRENLGNPDMLWGWLEKNATKDIKAAVISGDSMLYGSLVGSRKHHYGRQLIMERAELFKDFRKRHKKLPIYVFSSIMRTPRSGLASGYEEPDYYRNYGTNIFRYTELTDKKETDGLTARETKELDFLKRLIPERALNDWMDRRSKNFDANKKLTDMAKSKVFDFLVIGRDDNAPFSQTHMESRHLKRYAASVDKNKLQNIAGIDEVGLLLLTRAINAGQKKVPSVYVRYNSGRAGFTVPTYSDETIDESINDELSVVGAKRVNEPGRAGFILAVNTNPNGMTYEGGTHANDGKERNGTKYFLDLVRSDLQAGRRVVIADIAFANGADNALMERLKNQKLLSKLQAYSGWNTATNSTGFAVGSGILTQKMSPTDKKSILLTRLLDDWAYQSNVRGIVSRQLNWMRGDGFYGELNEKRFNAETESTRLINSFFKNNLSDFNIKDNITVRFPWNRMFEAQFEFH